MSILNRIEQLDHRILYVSLIAVICFALLYPLALPVRVSDMTQVLYDKVQSLPAGSRVAFPLDIGPSMAAEYGPTTGAVFTHVMRRPVKVYIMCFNPDGPLMYQRMLSIGWAEIPKEKKYGEDYVFLGYLAGNEIAMASAAADIQKAFGKDYYGTPLDQISMMKEVRNAKDFTVVLQSAGSVTECENLLRQWQTTYGVELAWIVTSMMQPTFMPYYPRQVLAIIAGPRSAAEYELLIRRPSLGLQTTDVLSVTNTLIIVYVVAGEIAYRALGLQKKKTGGV